MTDPPMAPVEVLGVGRLKTRHDPGQRDLLSLDRLVHVVVHQAIGQNPKLELPPVVGEPAKVVLPVSVVAEVPPSALVS
jgi:hypothetical protein